VSKEIALFVVEQMKDFDSNVQHIMFEFFFLHPLFNGVLPNYLGDLKCVKQNHEILSNMKVEITTHLTSPRKSDLVVAKKIMCMLTFGSSNGSSRGVARILDVDKCNIRKALGR
jgi:hypothetical protein